MRFVTSKVMDSNVIFWFFFVGLNFGVILFGFGADIVVDNCAICRNHIMDLCK